MDAITRLKALLAELEAAQAAPLDGENVSPPDLPSDGETESVSDDNVETANMEAEGSTSDNGTTEMEPSVVESVEIIAPEEPSDITVATPDNPEGGVNFRFGEIQSKLNNLDAAIKDALFRIGKMEENITTINTAIDVAAQSPAISVATDIGEVVRRL